MSRKRFKPEEIVNKLREADVLIAKGQTVAQACKHIGATVCRTASWAPTTSNASTPTA